MDQARAISRELSMEGETAKLAFVDAVTTHQSLVFSVAYHMLHNTTLAEETAQDVFFRLFRDYHRIKNAAHLIHWLRRTTTHRCLDILRHSERHSQISLDDVEMHLPSTQPDHDPILGQTLRRFVAELPARARAVVVLRFQEDLEPREIAQVLDLPINTVKSRLQRALVVLRGKLASLEESPHESHRG
jgi:RNA polymerase sigma-70 factor (ECF subfamily)